MDIKQKISSILALVIVSVICISFLIFFNKYLEEKYDASFEKNFIDSLQIMYPDADRFQQDGELYVALKNNTEIGIAIPKYIGNLDESLPAYDKNIKVIIGTRDARFDKLVLLDEKNNKKDADMFASRLENIKLSDWNNALLSSLNIDINDKKIFASSDEAVADYQEYKNRTIIMD